MTVYGGTKLLLRSKGSEPRGEEGVHRTEGVLQGLQLEGVGETRSGFMV